MSLSQWQELTAQFYLWEQRGRGWFLSDEAIELEPAFEPFLEHYVPKESIDDGRKPGLWQRIAAFFVGRREPEQVAVHEEEILYAHPYTDTAPLTVFAFSLPKHFKGSVDRMEQVLVLLSLRKSTISFELIGSQSQISVQCTCRTYDALFVSTQLAAFFPDVHVQETTEDAIEALLEVPRALYTVDFGLQEECMRPIAQGGQPDPYTPLLGIMERLQAQEYIIFQVLFCGTQKPWAHSMQVAASDNSGKASFFLDDPDMPRLAKEKGAKPLFGVCIRAVATGATVHDALTLLQHTATAITHASTSATNKLVPLPDMDTVDYDVRTRLEDVLYRETHRTGMLLNSRELATFVHLPEALPHSTKLVRDTCTTKAAPAYLLHQPYVIGENMHQRLSQSVGLSVEQRLRHIHIMGATGTGKSTLLNNLMMQDIRAGNGLLCLDPHGDLINGLLAQIPAHRINDVVLIDPTDAAFPIGFNILAAHSDIERELLASDLAAVFKRFSTSFGDQMYSVLSNAIFALLYNSKTYHLGDLRKFLIESAYRTQILLTVSDPDIVYYWQKEYPLLKAGASTGPILTRLDSFLRPKVIRNMVCQTKSIDFGALMDSKKIVLVKLSQGLLGAENSYLLGAFIVSKLQQTAMARQAKAIGTRVPFFCYIDEFHHFVTPSMSAILSGARKYGLGLVLAHQDMQQVQKYDADVASSVLANAATRMCFRLADTDAKRMQEGFSSFTADDLQNLRIGEAIARVNTADADFNLTITPLDLPTEQDNTEKIIAYSRATYSVPIQSKPVPAPEPIPNVPAPPKPVAIAESIAVSTPTEPKPLATPTPTIETPKQHTDSLREHRYTQAFIKTMAEQYGYKANIEAPTPDGRGQVDVLLEKERQTIAIEISVSTDAVWELHNIRKCLAANYSTIVVCATKKKLLQIGKRIKDDLSLKEQGKIKLLVPEDIATLFVTDAKPKESGTVMKGYRVKVKYDDTKAQADTEGIIGRIIRNAGR